MRWLTTPALALALALAAHAGDGANPVDDFFKRWDANKDGVVTRDECESTRLFLKNDKNGDGKITRDEVEAVWKAEEGSEPLTEPGNAGPEPGKGKPGKGAVGLPAGKPGENKRGAGGMTEEMNKLRIKRIFAKYDKNGDNSLSADEAAAYYFDVLDTDRDGMLIEAELAANPRIGAEKAKAAMQFYDKDGDGMIAAAEWSLPEDGTFTKIDANGDGKISFDEALAGFKLPGGGGGGGDTAAQAGRGQAIDPVQYLKENDADGDGKISAAEFKGPKQMFGKIDTNGDGFLDKEELTEAQRKLARMGGGAGKEGGGKGAGSLAELIKRADKDGDGKVTRAEWPGRPQMFDRLDKNGDGVLDEADFGGAPAKGTEEPGTMEGGSKDGAKDGAKDGGTMEGDGSKKK